MIRLSINVTDIDQVIMVYHYIRIYRSLEQGTHAELGTYEHLAFVTLQPDQSVYYYDDIQGTPDYWYRSSYYTSDTIESSLSSPAQGTAPDIYHTVTYPEEVDFDWEDYVIVRKIRRLIGDFKGIKRLYIVDEDTSCQYIHEDGKTVELGEKGWPVSISLYYEGQPVEEKTSLTDPVVQGYKYLTFSGTLDQGSGLPTIDIWYYDFKFSDLEVYEAYGDAMVPAQVPTSMVTQDHLILQAAIDLLENMTSDDMTADGAQIRDDQTLYDPSPGLRERDKTIGRLKARLDDLITETIRNQIILHTGVLID